MSDWATELPAAIRAALAAGGGEIVVRTETQAMLGEGALERMAPGAEGITFRVDPSADAPRLVKPPQDYRIAGPDEARQIIRGHRACETAPNGTGARCTCSYDCANYWLRAKGYKGDGGL